MKKLILIFAICTSGLFSLTANAQISLMINISSQPVWGPVGYDYVEYYYLPEIEVYYYVPSHMYIYMEGGNWISRSYLPQRYRYYDVYHSRKVVINEQKPYMHHNNYRQRYSHSQDYSNQLSIRDSHEEKYFQNKNHPEHDKWEKSNKDKVRNVGNYNGKTENHNKQQNDGRNDQQNKGNNNNQNKQHNNNQNKEQNNKQKHH